MNFFSLFKRKVIFLLKKKVNIDKHYFKRSTSLEYLFSYYGTDKAEKYKNGKGHGFSKYYIKHIKKFKDKKIKFLEIGCGEGISAAAFTKFLKKSTAYCLDVNLTNVKIKSKRINYFGLHSSNTRLMLNFLKKNNQKRNSFNFIIDDGSHDLSDQLFSLNFFFKYLKKNSLYIIEDYKFPDYFKRNYDVKELKISEMITKIRLKKYFKSKFIEKDTIKELFSSKIYQYKGNKNHSDICFIKKK
ncbi:class I SAM-dependent methyltransferase [Pelagibacteraceae bacterium]|nr:class I SAM-dependent methyltransferase [Pelagibacteraceae bacterium]